MTVSSTQTSVTFTGDGVTTVIPVSFPFIAAADLVVTLDGVTKTLGVHYTVGGGSVTFMVAPAGAVAGRIRRATPFTQPTDYLVGDTFPAETHERALDRLTYLVQEAYAATQRAIRVPDYDTGLVALPDAATRAGKSIVFDSVGGLGVGGTLAVAAASAAEAKLGTDNSKYMTALTTRQEAQRIATTPEQYGAAGDGVTDDTAAFTAALAANKLIQLRPGATYLVTGITISSSKSGIVGGSRAGCEIKVNSTTAKGITISDGLANITLKGFKLSRVGTPAAGADGIYSGAAVLGTSIIEDVICEGHYDGVSLGVTDYSFLNRVLSQKNYRDGFRFQNVGTNGQVQWNLSQCFAQFNDGNGFIVKSGVETGQITLGNWDSCGTFANTGRGMAFEGTTLMPVQGTRLHNPYVGDDNGGAGIYFDTYGTFHRVIGGFVELVGRGLSGRNYNTAATLVGVGIWATANNNALTVTDTRIDSCSYDGIQSGARAFNANGCDITDNGLALTANRRNGIKLIAGTSYASIMGGTSGARLAGASQQYAVEALAAAGTTIMGMAAMNLSAGLVAGALPNIIGNTVGGHFFISDGVILGVPTGVNKGAGTINSAGDQYKNNTAYTNP